MRVIIKRGMIGIIGITRNDSARDRFCLTWSERSHITQETRHLFGLEDDNCEAIHTRHDVLPGRMRQDEEAVRQLVEQFNTFNVFNEDNEKATDDCDDEGDDRQLQPQLISLTTKDVATDEIQKDLITAEERGKALICKYVKENLVDKNVSIYQSLTRNKSNTFSDLYKTPVTNKQNEKKVLKADKKLIQKLFNASVAGRKVQMGDIFSTRVIQSASLTW